MPRGDKAHKADIPNKRIRVLHIIPSSMWGGGPEHLWQLTRRLPPRIDSLIAAPRREPYWPRFRETVGAERVFEIPQRRFSFRTLWKLRRWAKAHDVDIIHSHGKGGGVYGRLLAVLLGKASVHTFHGIHLPASRPLALLLLTLERALCFISDACIVVSQGEKEQASSLRLGEGRIVLLSNGVYVPESIARVRREPFDIVHVTRFDPVKNSFWLLRVAVLLREQGRRNFRFVVIGDGEGLTQMRQEVKISGLESYFLFTGAQTDIRPYLRGARCYFSCSGREGMPLAVLEAQSEGVPAVVSDVTGNRDAIEHDVTGFAFPLGDAPAAVRCLGLLMDDKNLGQRMGMAGYKRARELFSVEGMAERTAGVYERVLAG